jgi:hypothetical protein
MTTTAAARMFTCVLAGAAIAPAGAQARILVDPSAGSAPPVPVVVPARPAAAPSAGFQWDDAGIGAAAAALVLGAGAASMSLAGRRRRALSASAG